MTRSFSLKVLLVAVLFGVLSFTATADTLKLKDGRALEGTFQGGTASVLKFEISGTVHDIPVETVLSLTFKKLPPPPASPPSAAAPQVSGPVTVNAGTRLMIRTENNLDTGSTKSGERFTCALEANLVVNGVVVAPKGSQVYGKVVESVKAKRVRGKAKLLVELTDIMIKGQLQPIVSEQLGWEGDRSGTVKKVGAGAAVGALAGDAGKGAAVGGALAVLTKGKQIQIPAGTLLEFRLAQPLSVNL